MLKHCLSSIIAAIFCHKAFTTTIITMRAGWGIGLRACPSNGRVGAAITRTGSWGLLCSVPVPFRAIPCCPMLALIQGSAYTTGLFFPWTLERME